jgi:hypothetical protein
LDHGPSTRFAQSGKREYEWAELVWVSLAAGDW